MPKVALLTLVGVLALAGLPPLNGFASEWLLLQTFLLTPSLPNSFLNMLIPVAAGGLVLASALAAYVMVKFYGVVFLGQPREEKLKTAHDADFWERLGMGWLALGCILLGILPVSVVLMLDKATKLLVGVGIGQTAGKSFFFLTPIASERASYSPLFFLLVVLAVVILTFVAVRFFYHGRVHRAPAWDCGFGVLTPRMEDTAEGFGQPIRQILEPVFSIERQMPDPFSEKSRYHIQVEDRLWTLLYRPVVRVTEWVAARIAMMQHGRIYGYLLYMFATLLLLLFFAR
jgi:NADH:ubiquinone oxidoreductase subunit 5 (subunit L)/multisubunit Na+/H+ antiporter MnhA subunit